VDAYHEILGIPKEESRPQPAIGVSFQMIPIFEEKVLEHKDGHYIVRDWMGAITEISDEFDYTYIRGAKDFVTRKWHRFPVQNRDDWEEMKTRFDPQHTERFADDFEESCVKLQDRDDVAHVHFNGPFWQLREWVGMENLCILMVDEPEWIEEMVQFWTTFVSETLAPILERVTLDSVGISEDMAYKAHSMISPAMVRRFLMPAYKVWVPQIYSSGCPIIDMDSDGDITELIPLWIEAEINVCDPIEVAAHNDIVEFRKRFGHQIAYKGGIDKRAIAAGGDVIQAELDRIAPVVEDGGFIPACDHGVPSDISWSNFLDYTKRLAKITGWL
jgi:uroporphyrinogen decarboxylase